MDRSRWCYPDPTGDGLTVSADAPEKDGFRLPTEAEWEGICRADTETARHYGDSQRLLSQYAWTWLNSEDRVHPAGILLPNELGMFDILGNVWEWCHDGPPGWYPRDPLPAYPAGSSERPAGDPGREEKVLFKDGERATWRILRGGAFDYPPVKARSAHRDWIASIDQGPFLGFRIVRTLSSTARGAEPAEVAARRPDPSAPARVPARN